MTNWTEVLTVFISVLLGGFGKLAIDRIYKSKQDTFKILADQIELQRREQDQSQRERLELVNSHQLTIKQLSDNHNEELKRSRERLNIIRGEADLTRQQFYEMQSHFYDCQTHLRMLEAENSLIRQAVHDARSVEQVKEMVKFLDKSRDNNGDRS